MLIKCKECGKEHSDMAVTCPNCGYSENTVKQKLNDANLKPKEERKSKSTTGILAFVLFGSHLVYLGRIGLGILCIILDIFCYVTIYGLLVNLGFALYYWTMNQEEFDRKYNTTDEKRVPIGGILAKAIIAGVATM